MHGFALGGVMFFLLLALMLFGIPITFSLGIVSAVVLLMGDYSLLIIPHRLTSGVDVFVLLAVPYFILAGKLMNLAELTDRIFNFAKRLVGHLPGGLGHVNVLASMIFAGMSGAALADVEGLGTVEIKAMTDAGYSKPFSVAITAASSTIGPIIPPSIPLIIYGVIGEVSIAKLFLAGVIPGVLLGGLLMAIIWYLAGRQSLPVFAKGTFTQLAASFIEALPALMIPFMLVVSMLTGLATPTEIGTLAVVYAIILGYWFSRGAKIKGHLVWNVVSETAEATGSIMIIISSAALFSTVLTLEQIPQKTASYIISVIESPPVFLMALNVFLLIVGCLLDATSAIVILVPALLPTAVKLGIDPVHFGMVVVLNLMIGLITPPFGLVLYAISDMTGMSIFAVVRALLPYYFPLLGCLILVTFVPYISLFLPGFIF